MASFRFVHAADIHLDSPLVGLARQEGQAARRICAATREAFDNLVQRTIDEEASFLVVAGDLYDGDWRDYQTGLFFVAGMGRLAQAGIPAFLLYGNHDAESRITRRLMLPDNVRAFSARKAETFEIDELGVALHGRSYQQRDTRENLAACYPPPKPGAFNIGVLHTALDGRPHHDPYAPCTLQELIAKGYDYWALGHVHQYEVIHENPHVVFPGNLQGRHIREAGEKGACLVTVEEGEVAALERLPVDVVRWARVEVSADGCDRLSAMEDRVRTAIREAVSRQADGRLLACRIEIAGASKLHDRLLASQEDLLAEARAAALALGDEAAWIERLVVATEPVPSTAAVQAREDALGELRRDIHGAHQDPDLIQRLQDDIGVLLSRLPHEVRDQLQDTPLGKALQEGDYAELIREAGDYLAARLARGKE